MKKINIKALIDATITFLKGVSTKTWIAVAVTATVATTGVVVGVSLSEHEHAYGEWAITQEATCTQTGVQVRTCECGEDEKESIPALGHIPSTEWVVDIEPTCTTVGSKSHHCSRCDGKADITELPALGHSYSTKWTIDLAPTCNEKGSKSHHCSRCDDKSGVTQISANGHSFGEWIISPTPTCNTEGNRRRDCSVCEYYESKVINATGHTNQAAVVENKVDATCTADGSCDSVIYCSVCDAEVSREEKIIAALGHSYGEWTQTLAPTCTEKGSERRDCSVCEHFETQDVNALGHNYSTEWTIDTEATCSTSGRKSHHCSRCTDNVDVTEIPALGHYYNSVATKETCISEAISVSTCSRCNEQHNLTANAITFAVSYDYTWTDGSPCLQLTISNISGGLPIYGNSQPVSKKYSVKIMNTISGGVDEFTDVDELTESCVPPAKWTANGSYYKVEISDGYCTYVYTTSYYNQSLVSVDYVIPHAYTGVVTEPTKMTDGYTIYTCTVCQDTYTGSIIPATGSIGLEYKVNSNGTTCTITGMGNCTDTEIYIPNTIDGYTVTAIGEKAFAENSTITFIKIPDTITTIGRRAFYKCTEITEFTVPESVTNIDTQIFYGCDKLITVYYNGKYGNKDNPFLNVKSIETVVFGGTRIPDYVAYNTTFLKKIVISDDVTSIGSCSFYDSSALTSVEFAENSRLAHIGREAFYGCISLVSITIPDTVKTISEYAFYKCSNLTNVTIPDSVTTIDERAFAYCSNLTSITIPDSVTTISAHTFVYCSNLMSVTIPGSVTIIGREAFYGCSSLTSITIPDSITTIGECAFSGCDGLTSVTIPDSVTAISSGVFKYCSNLTSVTIPDSVTIISDQAFMGCSNLTNVTIPDSVTIISAHTFAYCSNLTSVTIPDSVTIIDYAAFYGSDGLTSVTIPASVTTIGEWAFSYCSNLTSITFRGTIEQWNAISKDSKWNRGTSNYTIYCTDGNISK